MDQERQVHSQVLNGLYPDAGLAAEAHPGRFKTLEKSDSGSAASSDASSGSDDFEWFDDFSGGESPPEAALAQPDRQSVSSPQQGDAEADGTEPFDENIELF
jgi:hypothetical protein